MDAVINILLGACAGLVIAGWNRSRPSQRFKLMVVGMIGASLPSLDELTLWAGFDRWIGSWLVLPASGHEIYFGTFWYSHQGFFHSLLAGFLLSILLGWVLSLVYYHIMKGTKSLAAAFRYLAGYMFAAGFGFYLHLLGDIVAPGGPWGGIRLFYPLHTYVGGWGLTWWWNNYDIALILVLALAIGLIYLSTAHPLKKGFRLMPMVVLLFSLTSISWQLSQREFNFNHHSYTAREIASKQIQRQLLGDPLTKWMEWFDQKLPVYF